MIATRIARRLARKLIKPAALWLNARQLRVSEEREQDFIFARGITIPLEREERLLQVRLVARRNQIQSW